MKRKLLASLLITIVSVFLTSCSGNGRIAGTYENVDGELLIFATDGSMRTIKGSDIGVGTYSTKGDDIELTYKGIAQKYGYSIKKDQLILYSLGTSNNVSTGIVYMKTAQAQNSVARSEAALTSVIGIYEERAYDIVGKLMDHAYIFKADGTYRHLENSKSTEGTYTLDGTKLILKSGDTADVWYGEIRDGDLMLFAASSAHSDGTYYKNVTSKYEIPESHYQQALELNRTEQYEAAMNAFMSINEYWDSYTLGREAGYNAAYVLYDKKEYREALKILNQLDDFDDYKSIHDECKKEVAKEDISLISLAATRKSNSMQQSANYNGRVFEFTVDITNGSPDEIIDLQGTMNIYNNKDTQLMSVPIYNGDGVKPGLTRTIRLTVDARGSGATEELYNTVINNLNVRFVLDSVTFEGTTYTNINQETSIHNAAAIVSMENDGSQTSTGVMSGDALQNQSDMVSAIVPEDVVAYNTAAPAAPTESTAAGVNFHSWGYPQQAGGDWSYMIPDSSTRYLSRAELERFSKYDLRIARNEIYARHGRKFADSALSNYFNSKAWYTPSVDADKFNDDVLNKVERTNIELIKIVEASVR